MCTFSFELSILRFGGDLEGVGLLGEVNPLGAVHLPHGPLHVLLYHLEQCKSCDYSYIAYKSSMCGGESNFSRKSYLKILNYLPF